MGFRMETMSTFPNPLLNFSPFMTSAQSFQVPLNNHTNCTWGDFEVLTDKISNFRPFHYNDSYKSDGDVNSEGLPILHWILAAIVFIIVRTLVERYIFFPIGKWLGIKDRSKTNSLPCRLPSSIPFLEKAFLVQKKTSPALSNQLVSETGLSSMEIERWFRRRRALGRPSKLTKFSESGWRFVCYLASASLGFWVVWDQPWAWDHDERWKNFPNISVTPEMRLYYLYGTGLYLSFLFTQFFDVKRKDFWEMLIHHVITLVLLGGGWKIHITRLALLTLVVHDCADVFLEAAKMANYAKKCNLANGIFFIFTMVWIVTRLIIYPKNIVLGDFLYLFRHKLLSPVILYPLVTLGTALFCLHIFWTYFIFKIIAVALTDKLENTRDSRSSTESDSEDDTPITYTTDDSEIKSR